MNEVKAWFSKLTRKLRYNCMFFIIKYVTPRLYKSLNRIYKLAKSISETPRPSTKFMRKYFDNKLLVGAEVGVSRGNNAFSLINTLNIKKLYLIDVYARESDIRDYNEAKSKMGVYGDRVQFIIKKSVDASKDIKEPLDFVYIDADHSYSSVYEDLECWYPLVKEGGVVCGHDVINDLRVIHALQDWSLKIGIVYTVDFPDFYFIK